MNHLGGCLPADIRGASHSTPAWSWAEGCPSPMVPSSRSILPGSFRLWFTLVSAAPGYEQAIWIHPFGEPIASPVWCVLPPGGVGSFSVHCEDTAALRWEGNLTVCSVFVRLWGELWALVGRWDFRHKGKMILPRSCEGMLGVKAHETYGSWHRLAGGPAAA